MNLFFACHFTIKPTPGSRLYKLPCLTAFLAKKIIRVKAFVYILLARG